MNLHPVIAEQRHFSALPEPYVPTDFGDFNDAVDGDDPMAEELFNEFRTVEEFLQSGEVQMMIRLRLICEPPFNETLDFRAASSYQEGK